MTTTSKEELDLVAFCLALMIVGVAGLGYIRFIRIENQLAQCACSEV
jgi:hypothetical protein